MFSGCFLLCLGKLEGSWVVVRFGLWVLVFFERRVLGFVVSVLPGVGGPGCRTTGPNCLISR